MSEQDDAAWEAFEKVREELDGKATDIYACTEIRASAACQMGGTLTRVSHAVFYDLIPGTTVWECTKRCVRCIATK